MVVKRVRSLSEVKKSDRNRYVRKDGWYVLKSDDAEFGEGVDGDDADDADDGDDGDDGDADRSRDDGTENARLRAKVREMRNRNIKQAKELDELKAKFDGLDVEALTKAAENARNAEEKELMRAGKWDEVWQKKEAALKAAHEKDKKALEERAAKAEKLAGDFRRTLHGDRVSTKLRAEADRLKVKLVPSAVQDFNARGMAVFTDVDEEGELWANGDEEGDYRRNAEGKRYSPADFVAQMLEEAPHMFEGASGDDTKGGGKRGVSRRPGGPAVVEVDVHDPKGFGDNIEDIASGKKTVRLTGS